MSINWSALRHTFISSYVFAGKIDFRYYSIGNVISCTLGIRILYYIICIHVYVHCAKMKLFSRVPI